MPDRRPALAQLIACLILVRLGDCSLGLSRHQCIEESTTFEEHRVCYFYNILLWKGHLYYVADDVSLGLPRVSVRFGVGLPNEMWLQSTVVPPDDTRFNGKKIVALAGDTYLWSTLPENNWYHQAGEYLPSMHNTICKYLGRCHLNQTRGLHLVEMFPARDFPWAPWIDDLTTCFSDSPKIRAADSALDDTVFLVEKALVGVGPECRARLFCAADPNFSGRRPVPPHQLASYRSRMADCLGFDAKRVARVEPKLNMLVVDRRYSSGRHFVNIGEVMESLRLRYHRIADISLQYLEGMSVGQQVALWSNADVVIHMHGAAQGSWQFLPHNAVVVHVVPFPRGVAHDTQFADKWVADFQLVTNLTYVPANNLDMAFARLRFEAIWGNPEWRALSTEDRLRIIETGDCEFLTGDVKDRCTMWWVHKNLDLVLTPEVLLPAVDAAVRDIYGKLGLQPPPLAGLSVSF